jgi:metal-responsive CopG/Arc/MetJ family transcriptional regulator
MKTAVSIPDDLFAEAEKLAGELELSRSALYAKALKEMMQRLKDEAVTAQMNAALAEHPDEPDQALLRYNMARLRRELEDNGGQW